MVLLQTGHAHLLLLQSGDGACRSVCSSQRCESDDIVLHSGATDCTFVIKGRAAERRVYDQIDFITFDQVDYIRTSFVNFVDSLTMDAGIVQKTGGAASCNDLESKVL